MEPTGGVTAHVTAVFEFPLTVAVKLALWPPSSAAVLGDKLRLTAAGGVAISVAMAVAVLVGSATLDAIIVTVWRLEIVAGAVYTPLTMVPTAGLRDQVSAVLLVPVTEAPNVADAPAPSDVEAGPIVTATGVRDTQALAVLVVSAALVAVTVTTSLFAIIAGAWYTPLVMVPSGGFKDHVTAVFEVPLT
jgi:hypothetical protein